MFTVDAATQNRIGTVILFPLNESDWLGDGGKRAPLLAHTAALSPVQTRPAHTHTRSLINGV